jgi:hypothetical protein
MLPNELFVNLLDLDLQERIANAKQYDFDVQKMLASVLEHGPTSLLQDLHDWKLEEINGKTVLFYKNHNYVPQDILLRHDIVGKFHDTITAGHPGEIKMFNSVQEHFWWPGLCSFVKNYVKGCAICQQFKIN